MARVANPDKPKIDALRAEGSLHVKTIKAAPAAIKKLAGINSKLEKLGVATIPVPEVAAPAAAAPAKAKTPAKVATKPAKAEKVTAKAAVAPAAKGGKAAKSVTTAPKKRGRPAKNSGDELQFD